MTISLIKNSDLKNDSCLEVIKEEEVGATKILAFYATEMLAVHGCGAPIHDNSYKIGINAVTYSSSLNGLKDAMDWMMKSYSGEISQGSCNARLIHGSNFLSVLEKEMELFNNKTKVCEEKIANETKIAQEITLIDAKYIVDLSDYHANFVGVADSLGEAVAP